MEKIKIMSKRSHLLPPVNPWAHVQAWTGLWKKLRRLKCINNYGWYGG
jgi:hypothetical protein